MNNLNLKKKKQLQINNKIMKTSLLLNNNY